MNSDDKPIDDPEQTAAGNICINKNSAGGTCAHWEKEHGGPGDACLLCDCDTFIPNA